MHIRCAFLDSRFMQGQKGNHERLSAVLCGGQCGCQYGSATKQAQSIFAYIDPVHLPALVHLPLAHQHGWVYLYSPSPPAWPRLICRAPVHPV